MIIILRELVEGSVLTLSSPSTTILMYGGDALLFYNVVRKVSRETSHSAGAQSVDVKTQQIISSIPT